MGKTEDKPLIPVNRKAAIIVLVLATGLYFVAFGLASPARTLWVFGAGWLSFFWLFVPAALVHGPLVSLKRLAILGLGGLIGSMIVISSLSLALAQPQPIHADALVFYDDEFQAGMYLVPHAPLAIPVSYMNGAEFAMNQTSQYFADNFNINLDWHFWHYHDSTPDLWDWELLYEVAYTNNWAWHVSHDNETMEMLIMWTGQETFSRALSLPWLRGIIIKGAGCYSTNILIHEMGHQFGILDGECSNPDCAMAATGEWFPPYYGVSCGCWNRVMLNRGCLDLPPPSNPQISNSRLIIGPRFYTKEGFVCFTVTMDDCHPSRVISHYDTTGLQWTDFFSRAPPS